MIDPEDFQRGLHFQYTDHKPPAYVWRNVVITAQNFYLPFNSIYHKVILAPTRLIVIPLPGADPEVYEV